MVINHQPPEHYVDNNKILSVREIFQTIQTEGPFSGTPAIFIRLAGCNLQCPNCDTDYTSKRMEIAIQDIIKLIKELSIKGLVVITGGEPLRQGRIDRLISELIDNGYYVQIETNGTFSLPNNLIKSVNYKSWERSGLYIVISPKTPSLNKDIINLACAFKYVISAGGINLLDGLPIAVLGNRNKKQVARPPKDFPKHLIFVQPADVQDKIINEHNNNVAIESSMDFGYTFQLQIHKIVGLP